MDDDDNFNDSLNTIRIKMSTQDKTYKRHFR